MVLSVLYRSVGGTMYEFDAYAHLTVGYSCAVVITHYGLIGESLWNLSAHHVDRRYDE